MPVPFIARRTLIAAVTVMSLFGAAPVLPPIRRWRPPSMAHGAMPVTRPATNIATRSRR